MFAYPSMLPAISGSYWSYRERILQNYLGVSFVQHVPNVGPSVVNSSSSLEKLLSPGSNQAYFYDAVT